MDLKEFAIENARAEFGGVRPPVTTETHWLEYDAERIGGRQRAGCGALVDPQSFSTEPTCVACREFMAAVEAMEF